MAPQVAKTAPPATSPAQSSWTIDRAHSSAEFAIRHMMIATVKGRFHQVAGVLHLDRASPERSRVEATIATASIDTGDPQRDGHLRSPDFFDAPGHPEISFRSRRVDLIDGTRALVVGDLTIRGVTREVPLQVSFDGEIKDTTGTQRAAFSAEATIDRRDFGLVWNQPLEGGGVLLSDKVKLALHIEAIQQASRGAA